MDYQSVVLNKKITNIYAFMCAIYCCFLVIYSIDLSDSGFILSFVERIKNGQQIYKDFDYVRPFGSVLTWDMFLFFIPKNFKYLFILSRIIVLLQIGLISYLLYKIFFKEVGKAVIILLFIFITHNFNIMPWHTIDGMLFSILSIYFFKRQFYLSALLFVILATSTKQSFYIFGLIAFCCYFFVFLKSKFQTNKTDLIIFLVSLTFLSLGILELNIVSNYSVMVQQITGSSNIEQFLTIGFKSYLFERWLMNLLLFISLILLYFIKIKQNILFTLFTTAIIYISISPFFNEGNFVGVKMIFLYLGVLSLKQKQNLYFNLLFILAWCTAISWGYNSPIFLLFVIYFILFKEFFLKSYYVYSFILLGFINFFLIRIQYPYFNKSPLQTKYIFVKDINAISGLFINKETYDYIKEAQLLHIKYKKSIFLPGSPLVDIVNNSYLNRSSWEMDIEYPSWQKDIGNITNTTFIIDKNAPIWSHNDFFKSSFTNYIIKKRSKIDSTNNFMLYK